ncbi:MAG: glutamate formimidoyltransferase [Bacteroidales bacterium]|nr:glutamate formimidoyltransferase [Bacteroidales bacterium]
MKRLAECVPNFSEGRNPCVIKSIAEAIANATVISRDTDKEEKVKLLDIDSGAAANRTVMTFAGSPEAVAEAAFRGIEAAGKEIDMRIQHGTHPRIGAADVVPIVPISGITLEECAVLARNLAKRVYKELGIPCYCYEAAALNPERKRLEVCREGGYESLEMKIQDPSARPDFGPGKFTETAAKSGASIIGARNFLVAVNFNLDTKDKKTASEIAKDVRESGRNGHPGTLKGVKALGWYIEEYGFAQVSMNITDLEATPLHKAFEEVCRAAGARGRKITGTEIIGLVPEKVLTDAGEFFAQKYGQEPESEKDLIETAIKKLNLSQIHEFDAKKKIIEYKLFEDINSK